MTRSQRTWTRGFVNARARFWVYLRTRQSCEHAVTSATCGKWRGKCLAGSKSTAKFTRRRREGPHGGLHEGNELQRVPALLDEEKSKPYRSSKRGECFCVTIFPCKSKVKRILMIARDCTSNLKDLCANFETWRNFKDAKKKGQKKIFLEIRKRHVCQ